MYVTKFSSIVVGEGKVCRSNQSGNVFRKQIDGLLVSIVQIGSTRFINSKLTSVSAYQDGTPEYNQCYL